MTGSTLKRILYIEDDIGLARLLQRRLAVKNLEFDIAVTGLEGLAKLKSGMYDLILLDNFLPDMNGIDLLDQIQPLDQQPPVILLTAGGDERLAVTALEKGAADYAVKDVDQFYIELLPAIMQAAFTRYRLMHENRQQREDLEKAWQKAQAANQAKSEFLATMSHEIRTPLNVILGIATLLERTALDAKQHEMIDVLHTNATVLLGLVNDVLDFSRIESGQMTLEAGHFNVKQILDNMEAMFALEAEKKGLVFTIENQTGAAEWQGDAMRLQQIVMNLVSNAIKFTEKGTIAIKAEIVPQTGALQISVRDTGIGISQDKLEAIFSKFVQADQSITRRFGGSGLGLSLAQSFARMMKGEITVNSIEGQGSVFTVLLGLPQCSEKSSMPEPKSAVSKNTEATANERLLLVEDYPANIMIATMMLEQMNYQVDVVSSGQEAVDKACQAEKPYHAIIMDIQMHGMDGFEATRRIRAFEKGKNVRHYIIGATAHALAGDKERCLEAGMDDYISKPIDWEIMGQKLHRD